jgi:hypothetical protein
MRAVLASRRGCDEAFVGWRERPPWIVQDEYEWLWLYAAVEPTTGTGVFLLLPTMEGTCLELFLRHLRHELGQGQIGVVLDSSGSHRSGAREMASWHASALFATLQSRIEPGRAGLPAYPQAPLHYGVHDA